MAESVDAELHQMNLAGKPSHYCKVDNQQDGRHSETRYRYRQMLPIVFLKVILLHRFKHVSSVPSCKPQKARYRPAPESYSQSSNQVCLSLRVPPRRAFV